MLKPKRMDVLFWIRKSAINKRGKAPIYFRISVEGIRSKEKSTGLNVELSDWVAAKQKCIENTYVNTQLIIITSRLQEIHSYLLLSRQDITTELILKHYYGQVRKKYSVLQLYDLFLKYAEKKVKKPTLDTYRYKRKHLAAYINTLDNEPSGEDITPAWCEKYTEWLEHECLVKMQRATIARCIIFLKKMLFFAYKNDYTSTNHLKTYSYSKGVAKIPVSLSIDEFNAIYVYPFASAILQQCADMFILQCLTGFDYEDIKNFTANNIVKHNNIDFIEYNRAKNNQFAIIPMHEGVKVICSKYTFNWPKISLHHYNRYLKQIAAIAGISLNLTSKIARKTFSDMMLNNERYTPATVSKMLGHTSPEILNRYYARVSKHRVINEENQRRGLI